MLREKWLYKRKITYIEAYGFDILPAEAESLFNKQQMQCHSLPIKEMQISA